MYLHRIAQMITDHQNLIGKLLIRHVLFIVKYIDHQLFSLHIATLLRA